MHMHICMQQAVHVLQEKAKTKGLGSRRLQRVRDRAHRYRRATIARRSARAASAAVHVVAICMHGVLVYGLLYQEKSDDHTDTTQHMGGGRAGGGEAGSTKHPNLHVIKQIKQKRKKKKERRQRRGEGRGGL